MAKAKLKDLDGKQIVCLGRNPGQPENVALHLEHSDPSRRSVESIDISRGMVFRIPQDMSEVDARFLLEVEGWHFKIEDQPQEQSEQPKGDK